MEYATGDHLGVLPRNNVDLIRRVLARFNLDAGTYVTINPTGGGSYTHLPLGEPSPLLGILGSCVELQDMASRSDLAVLARYAGDPDEKAELEAMSALDEAGRAAYRERVAAPRRTVLDLLDRYPSCDLPFDVYLDLLPPLRPRFYSISSSPAATDTCHLTVGVLRGPARSGEGEFCGVASGHLEAGMEGSTVFTFVRKPTIPFRPPANPHAPMIMVGAGTGMAPFRGFLQERADLKRQGAPIGESILFFGCRDSATDYLYAEELAAFAADGVTRVAGGLLARTRSAAYVCSAADRARARPRLGPAGGRCRDLRLRQRQHHGPRCPGRADGHVSRRRRADPTRRRGSGSPDCVTSDRYLEDIWGEMAAAV